MKIKALTNRDIRISVGLINSFTQIVFVLTNF